MLRPGRPCRVCRARRRARRTSAWCRRRDESRCRGGRRSASRYFRFWPTLSTLGSSSTGSKRGKRRLFRNLIRREAWLPAQTGRCRPGCRRRGGRSARSRLRCRRRRARSRTARAVIGSALVVLVSSATTPMSLARSIQAFRRSSVRTVSYLLRSNLLAFAAARWAAASAAGERSPRSSALLRGCGGGANRSPLLP